MAERDAAPGPLDSQAPRLGRYPILGSLGSGAFSEVYRVHDAALGRALAMKVLKQEHVHASEVVSRFMVEAQITAQLHHPGIVPVHEVGRLEDGRPYFTMQEVVGRTLDGHIDELWSGARPEEGALRRVIDVFLRLSEAVAYAHAHDVIHRDLKPANCMVGSFGQAHVMDWGLARLMREESEPSPPRDSAVRLNLGQLGVGAYRTQVGTVAGTPSYMSPEQASGQVGGLAPPSDVFSLGCILFKILTGRGPYDGASDAERWPRILRGEVDPLDVGGAPGAPPALKALTLWCLQVDPGKRPPTAQALTEALSGWLEGMRQREEAARLVAAADDLKLRWFAKRAEQEAHDRGATAPEETLGAHPHGAGDAAEQASTSLAREVGRLEVDFVETLKLALRVDPEQEAARDRLNWYRESLGGTQLLSQRPGEEGPDAPAPAPREEIEPAARPLGLPDPPALLKGLGLFSLSTDPPGARVIARTAPRAAAGGGGAVAFEGTTPITHLPLCPGAYEVTIRGADGREILYPVLMRRFEQWRAPEPLRLPSAADLPPGEVFVPPGWAWLGGDPLAVAPLPAARVWCGGMAVERRPISWSTLTAFLTHLTAAGRRDEAIAYAPSLGGQPLYRWRPGGAVALRDRSMDPGAPATGMSFEAARAVARWRADQSRRPWRLPTEVEWARMARGPWGAQVATPAERAGDPGSPPADPWGLLGLAGGLRLWCVAQVDADGRPAAEAPVARGGLTLNRLEETRLADRDFPLDSGHPWLGALLVRSWPEAG